MLDLSRLHSLLGDRIRRVRETQSPPMSQGRLAEILQLQRTSITNIEAGRQKPSLEILYRFCEHFGLAIGEFLPVVADVTLTESESLIVGSQHVQVGAKTADLIHELRAQHRLDPTAGNSARPDDE
jgi:DNA-binding XRE family transcriptional regulator